MSEEFTLNKEVNKEKKALVEVKSVIPKDRFVNIFFYISLKMKIRIKKS